MHYAQCIFFWIQENIIICHNIYQGELLPEFIPNVRWRLVSAHLQFALLCRNSVGLNGEEVEGVPDRVLHRVKHLPSLTITRWHSELNPDFSPLLNMTSWGFAAKEGIYVKLQTSKIHGSAKLLKPIWKAGMWSGVWRCARGGGRRTTGQFADRCPPQLGSNQPRPRIFKCKLKTQ